MILDNAAGVELICPSPVPISSYSLAAPKLPVTSIMPSIFEESDSTQISVQIQTMQLGWSLSVPVQSPPIASVQIRSWA